MQLNNYLLNFFDKEVEVIADVYSNTFLDKHNTTNTILRSNTNSNICNTSGNR